MPSASLHFAADRPQRGPSVLRRLLVDVVDDEHGNWALLLFELQAELLVEGLGERDRAARVGGLSRRRSSYGARGGNRLATSGGFGVGFSLTLSTTTTATGVLFNSSFSPSCFSTASKIGMPSAPALGGW